MKLLKNIRGVTLTELVVVVAVMSVLASVAMPTYRMSIKRSKEATLRAELREMRDAIDTYKKLSDDDKISKVNADLNLGSSQASGYPPTLEELTKVIMLVPAAATTPGTTPLPAKLRLLRRISMDPMAGIPVDPKTGLDSSGNSGWGIRSNEADPDSTTWDKKDVFDVYSLSEGTALDGTKYRDW